MKPPAGNANFERLFNQEEDVVDASAGTIQVRHHAGRDHCSHGGVSVSREWWARTLDGATQAARSTPAPVPQPKNTPAEADHPPVEPSAKAQAATWPDAEIIAALEECVRLLSPTGDEVEVSKPIRDGQCGTPAPVILKRVAGVELSPSALVNCRVTAKLHQWITQTVQPMADELLGAPIRRIVIASAYTCRQRIGTTAGRPSEH